MPDGQVMRGKGYLADAIPANRKTPFAHLARRLGAAGVGDSASVLDRMPSPFDQGQSGGCTFNAFAAAITAALRLQDQAKFADWVCSQDDGYKLERAIDRAGEHVALTDSGAEPNQGIRAIHEWGVRKMGALAPDGRYSDIDIDHVNDEPKLVDIEADSVDVLQGAYAITSTGAARRGDIATALSSGYTVCVAVDASNGGPLQNYSGGVLTSLGTSLDHYVCCAAYSGGTGDAMVLTVRNSWSAGFGEGGNFRIAGPAIDELGDLWVLDVKVTA